MTFVEIRDEIERLLRQVGAYDTEPTPNIPALANEALRNFSSIAEYMTADTTITTVLNQAEYDLTSPPEWIRITDADYNGQYPIELSSEDKERRIDPLFRRAAAAPPLKIWMPRQNVVRLHPKPATAGVTINISGARLDTDLDADTDEPNCNSKYHRHIARLAAYLHAVAYAEGDEFARIERWRQQAEDQAEELRGVLAETSSAVIQRNVRRRPARRVTFGIGDHDGGVISL